MKIKSIILVFLIVTPALSFAQGNRWKRFRYELVGGVGATNFLGELGGADQIGTDFYKDLELKLTRPAVNIGMRYKITPQTAVKAGFTWGVVAGDDALTKDQFRSQRSIHFRSHIVEFAAQYEFYLKKEQAGHRFRLRGVRGIKTHGLYPYGFFGLSAFWFNPRAKAQNGEWTSLRNLGTEGQFIAETRKAYSRISVAIPIGIGIKYKIARQWLIGAEYGKRKTFTDYIDDTSTTYWPNDVIADTNGENGAVAAYLADPTQGAWSGSGANQQRGDPTDNDSFMFLLITVNYTLQTTKGGLPKFR
ncbi:MAG: hypothetical protein ACJA0Q_001387 [Saprospiraceae bacterium]|jgi:hypothetical protein